MLTINGGDVIRINECVWLRRGKWPFWVSRSVKVQHDLVEQGFALSVTDGKRTQLLGNFHNIAIINQEMKMNTWNCKVIPSKIYSGSSCSYRVLY